MKRLMLLVLGFLFLACSPAGNNQNLDPNDDNSKADDSRNTTNTGELSAKDPLVVAVKRANTRWGDENISGATIRFEAKKMSGTTISTIEDLKQFAVKQLPITFESTQDQALPQVEIKSAEVGDIQEVADLLSFNGFGYAEENSEGRCANYWSLSGALDWLDEDIYNVLAATASTTVHQDDYELAVTCSVFYSPTTGNYASLFILQGTSFL